MAMFLLIMVIIFYFGVNFSDYSRTGETPAQKISVDKTPVEKNPSGENPSK